MVDLVSIWQREDEAGFVDLSRFEEKVSSSMYASRVRGRKTFHAHLIKVRLTG